MNNIKEISIILISFIWNIGLFCQPSQKLCGVITGTLQAGIYNVECDIFVPGGEQLIIEPGTILRFEENKKLDINGTLIAQGTASDSIIFESDSGTIRWGGIGITETSEGCVFEYVRISGSNSSGVYVLISDPVFNHVVINDNRGTTDLSGFSSGGGFLLNLAECTFSNCKIYNNFASKSGSAIEIHNSDVKFNNTIITKNVLNDNLSNGAVHVTNTDNNDRIIHINNLLLSENNSTGLFCTGNINLKVQNALFRANNVGISLNSGTNCSLNNSIVTDCNHYGIMIEESTISQINNLFWSNKTDILFDNEDPDFGKLVKRNLNRDLTDIYGNIFLDPMFSDDNSLQFDSLSPCIDAGINEFLDSNQDLYGKIRIADGNNDSLYIIDLGPVEFGAADMLSLDFIVQSVRGYGENNGSIEAFPFGGVEPYHYSWNNGNMTNYIAKLEVGEYTVTVKDYIGNKVIQEIDLQYVDTSVYSISGKVVLYDKSFIENGIVYLFDKNNYLTMVSSAKIKNGNFKLYNLLPSSYLIYAVPFLNVASRNSLPGYYNYSFDWNEVNFLDVEGGIYDLDVILHEFSPVDTGNGSIKLTIKVEQPNGIFTFRDEFVNDTINELIPIGLFSDERPIIWKEAKSKSITFTEIPAGEYEIKPLFPGYVKGNDYPLIFEYDEVKDLTILLRDRKYFIYETNNLDLLDISIYPTLVTDILNVDFKNQERIEYAIRIVNISGQVLFNQQDIKLPSVSLKQLNVSNYASGLYFIEVMVNNKLFSGKFIKNQ